MGKGFIYKCQKCKHEETLLVGVGFVCPNPPEIEVDIQNGLYGDKAKAFLDVYPSYMIDAALEAYQCKCGNIESKYHIVLKSPEAKSLSIRQRCTKCGSAMKMLNELPEKIACPECGSAMKLDEVEEILWD